MNIITLTITHKHPNCRLVQTQVLQSREMEVPGSYIFPLWRHGQSSGEMQWLPFRTKPVGHLQPDQIGPEHSLSLFKKCKVPHVGSHEVTASDRT